MSRAALRVRSAEAWVPPIHRIERWWSPAALASLGQSFAALCSFAETGSRPAANQQHIAFCRALIECSSAHFGHQSMSFAPEKGEPANSAEDRAAVARALQAAFERVLASAERPLPATRR